MGRKRKAGSRILGVFLSLAMAVTMFPTMASANEGTSTQADDNSPIQLSKTATLQSDGTYTIDLEAYVTGEIVTQIERKNKPTDIILVMDQSGSMAWSMSGLPDDNYSEAGRITNAQAYEGSYYYRVGNEYFPVTVKYASTSNVEKYVDDSGNEYNESQVATTWINEEGRVVEANGPYLESSLISLHRIKVGAGYYYVEHEYDTILGVPSGDGVAAGGLTMDAAEVRNDLRNNYQGYTVQFENSDYTAAVYTQLTPIYSHTYEYYYTDADGNLVALPSVGTANDDPCPYTLYQTGDSSGRRLDVLQYAAQKFVDSVQADAVTNNIDHRIAVVGFGSNGGNNDGYRNTEILTVDQLSVDDAPTADTNPDYTNGGAYFPDRKEYNGAQYGTNAYDSALGTALRNVRNDKQNINTAISALTAYGATRSDLGMQMAEDILSARTGTDKDRDAIVVFFTDGEPTSGSEFEEWVAADTINTAKELKIGYYVNDAEQSHGTSGGMSTGEALGYTASVYSVAVYDGASPTGSANINGSGATRINDFLHMVSSNYPEARGEKQGSRDWEFFRESGANNGYYMVANNAASLANAFNTIANNIHEVITTVNLDSESVLRDILSSSFTLPEGYAANPQITVTEAPYQGNGSWGPETASSATASVTGNTIDVTGFDYTENVVAEAADGQSATGKKLIVSIAGIEAKDSAATGSPVFTNTSESGVYDTVEGEEVLIKEFDRPTVTITNKSYVLDYGKEATFNTSDLGLAAASHINSDMSKITTANTAVNQKYGKSALASNAITYTPQTMNWDGYDSLFAFGTDSSSENQWARMNVLPANSVYYEDTFVTSESDGTVGIKYSDGWTEVGTAQNNTQTVDDSAYGWEDSYADDDTYSDGSAHTSSTAGATATFTFTGTGVDIYSKTDMQTGIIMAYVYEGEYTAEEIADRKDNEGNVISVKKLSLVDGKAETGDDGYYQVPTLSLAVEDENGDPIYGTYTVQLKVRSTSDGRSTYYLDGIRVYNPIQGLEGSDANVDQAYGDAGEANAVFQEVRDILIDSSSLTAGQNEVTGAVFIDKTADGTTGSSQTDVGTYKDYGAKNEVYLAKGQGIAFQVDPSMTYYLGLRAPDGIGKATEATVTNGDSTVEHAINSASDLYYKITPKTVATEEGDVGYIYVKNAGDNMLAVTKLRVTDGEEINTQNLFTVTDMPALMSYVADFDSLPVEEPSDSEDAVVTVPDDSEDETTDGTQTGDVVIENPDDDSQQSGSGQDTAHNTILSWINKIFSGIRSWFK